MGSLDQSAKIETQIVVNRVVISPVFRRRLISEQSIANLAQSILIAGLLSPIIVRPIEHGYELIAGERRLRAVKTLNHEMIRAHIVDVNACDAALISLMENIEREDLHFLEQAEAFALLISTHGFTQLTLAKRLNLSQGAVGNKLRLLQLPQDVRDALLGSRLTERHARALLSLPEASLQLEAVARAESEKMSVRQLESHIEKLRVQKPIKRAYKVFVRDRRMLVNAVLNAVKSLNHAGIKATSRIEEKEDCIEVVVSLPIEKVRQAAQIEGISAAQ